MSKTAGRQKITFGCVVQIFDDESKCIKQEFMANDDPIQWQELENGDFIPTPVHDFYPFEMVQPGETERTCKLLDDYAELLRTRIAEQDTEIAEKLQRLKELKESINV